MALPLILDVDTGVDDALALLLALRCSQAQVLAVTCVHGNTDVDQVLRNTLQVLDAAAAPGALPVARGFADALVEPPRRCPDIMGHDGLADLQTREGPQPPPGVQLLLDTLRAAASPVTVVALGPLTNVAVAIRTDPDVWREKLGRLVWMGGAVSAGGNSSAWAEANALGDPEAAHIVLASGLPVLIYPWDVFEKPAFSREELTAYAAAAAGAPRTCEDSAGALATRLMLFLMSKFGGETTIGDAGALAVALDPRLATVRSLHVAVELRGGHTRGMTVCDLRPRRGGPAPNVEVVVDVDAQAIKDMFAGRSEDLWPSEKLRRPTYAGNFPLWNSLEDKFAKQNI
ncbi:unnamed protein product [Prorocentrum cordatum]|uniref:Inosine/uridine-preferring nucleoside hydrolase domain-containing protein n=1 Tax=Prorocentrum cordatum TaxID=2364126 RepID=A0ABN9VF78_9DINO|nr:unnamed protein product [Polarella glacialis]